MSRVLTDPYMRMRTPQHALDVIASLILNQFPLEEQDAWLQACIKLGFVELEGEE